VRAAHVARTLLGGIRVVNGALALVAPAKLAQRLEVDPGENPAVLYALRMFGIRTVVIGADLLRGDERSVQSAVAVHASDTLAAAALARSGKIARRTGVLITAISALNTVLAVTARKRAR
jgi:hypothetical protein